MNQKRPRFLSIVVAFVLVFTVLLVSRTLLGQASVAASQAKSGILSEQSQTGGSINQISPPWYHPSWHYRLPVTISNSGAALSNYQVLVTLNASFNFSHAQPDGGDLRSTTSDGVTPADFWIESWDSANQRAYVWVKVPSIPSFPPGTSTIYLYYGNLTANAASDGVDTFEFFDDNWCPYPGSSGCGPTNPVQTATQSWWEAYTSYPMVFEDTSFPGRPRYHMLYDGHNVIGHAKGYAYSPDLNTWTEYDMGEPHPPNPNPIMGAGLYPGGTQYAWGDTIKVGSTYYMFASRGPGTTQRIESTDLITWTNFTTLVDDDPGGNIGTGVALLKEPDGITPIVVDGKYWMVYFRDGSYGTMYMASTPATGDLRTWTYTGGAFLVPTSGGFDAGGLWTPSFIRFDNMYYIYYQGYSGSIWETGYARASAYSGGNPIPPDPGSTTWTKSDTNGDGIPDSVLKRTPGGWDSGEVIDPMVRRFSDGVYYLFYTGNQNNGYATASAPGGPWTKLGSVNNQWTTVAGSPTVSNGILTLNQGVGLRSNATFQYRAVGYRANFGAGSGLLWGGFINGSQYERTMLGSVLNQPARLYLKNYITAEANALLCDGTCRDSFHTYEVLWRSGQSLGRMDHGAASASLTSQVPSIALPVTFYSYSSSGATLAVDWVYVRQYRDPEPTTQPGTEQCAVDMRIAKTDSPDPVHAAEPLTYTIVVTNSSAVIAPSVVVTDELPAGVTLVSADSEQGSCLLDEAVICDLGDLVPTGTVRITLVITSSVDGEITNTATVEANAYELVPSDNQTTETTTVLPSVDLGVSQVDEPDPVRAGEMLTYTITVHNDGPSVLAAVTLTDTLPTSVVLVSATPLAYCAQTSPVVCSLPGLPAGGSSQVQVVVQTTLYGLITNLVTVASATYDRNLGNNTSSESTVVATQADLAVSLVDEPDPVYAGDPLTYTITVHNAGPNIAGNVRLTDTLPVGVSLQSVIPSQGSCTPGAVVTCGLVNLDLGEDAFVTVVVTTSLDGIITNMVKVASGTSDEHTDDNIDVITTTVAPVADLWVSQVDEPDPVRAGRLLTYTLTVHNNGPSASSAIALTNTLPINVEFVSADPAVYCTQSSPVVCILPGLPAGGSSQVQVVVQTTLEGLLTNAVRVTSTTHDRNLGNNSSIETTLVATAADLSITQQDAPDPVLAEQELTYMLTVHNAGPSIAGSVRLTDTLPDDVTLVSVNPDQGICNPGSVITCELGDLPDGMDIGVEVVVIPQAEGSIANTVEVATETYEENLGDNLDIEGTMVRPLSADLQLTLADDPDPVAAGALLTYIAHVANLGPSRSIDPSVTIHLPSQAMFVTATPPCSAAGGIVTCLLDEIPSGGSMDISLVVQVSSSTFLSQIASQADVTAAVADPVPGNNHASELTGIYKQADLAIDILDTPDPVAPGTNLTYTLVYTNYGPSDAINLSLTDDLPTAVDFIRAQPKVCTPVPSTHILTCTPLDLKAGQVAKIALVVKVKEGALTPLVNQVVIASETTDPNLSNNTSQETTSLDDEPPSIHWIEPVKDESTPYIIVMRPGLVITLTVIVTDNVQVDHVFFIRWDHIRLEYVDIGEGQEVSPGVYQYVWVHKSCLELPDTLNAVFAYAYDTAGNGGNNLDTRKRIWILPNYSVLLPAIMK